MKKIDTTENPADVNWELCKYVDEAYLYSQVQALLRLDWLCSSWEMLDGGVQIL